jgi:hypothetical protein
MHIFGFAPTPQDHHRITTVNGRLAETLQRYQSIWALESCFTRGAEYGLLGDTIAQRLGVM